MVSKIISDMKRGKAADIYVLTVEHLQYSHPVLSVLLSKFFLLITLCRSVPNGFKRSYIVPIPKVQDCQTKATSCDDFRGIAAVNRDQHPKYLNLFTLSISLPSINTLWVPISAGSMTIIHVFAEFIFSPNKRLIFCDSLTWCCNSSGDVYLYS